MIEKAFGLTLADSPQTIGTTDDRRRCSSPQRTQVAKDLTAEAGHRVTHTDRQGVPPCAPAPRQVDEDRRSPMTPAIPCQGGQAPGRVGPAGEWHADPCRHRHRIDSDRIESMVTDYPPIPAIASHAIPGGGGGVMTGPKRRPGRHIHLVPPDQCRKRIRV
jgi:hypothetical protein